MMTETMIATIIGAVATLAATMLTQISTFLIGKVKSDSETRQNIIKSKRDNLSEVYKSLISVINIYPNASPNDILQYVEYSPNYLCESFDGVLITLDYQIEDYRKKLGIPNMDYERINDIKTQISNREYAKKRIVEIRDAYYKAQDKYKSFCESEKVIFELYAGQYVKNCLVEFEVVIHNVFISGYSVGDADDPLNNSIEISRRNLISSMRDDIGIF